MWRHGIKAFPPIMPDEMERIINTVRLIAAVHLDWYMDEDQYKVSLLAYTGDDETVSEKNEQLLSDAQDALDWLEPIVQKSHQRSRAGDIDFQPFPSETLD
jgi:glutamate formiminotransferase